MPRIHVDNLRLVGHTSLRMSNGRSTYVPGTHDEAREIWLRDRMVMSSGEARRCWQSRRSGDWERFAETDPRFFQNNSYRYDPPAEYIPTIMPIIQPNVMMVDPVNAQWKGWVSFGLKDRSHASARRIYERDFAVMGPSAGLCWASQEMDSGDFSARTQHNNAVAPEWNARRDYKYNPPDEWYIPARDRAAKRATPKPLITQGQTYYAPNLLIKELLHEGTWENTPQQQNWLAQGLIFTNRTRAHAFATSCLKQAAGSLK